MSFCLPKEALSKLRIKLKESGEEYVLKLADMSSEARRAEFSFLGELNAKSVNALFEKKLLLKNQQLGIIRWLQEAGGIKPEVQRDLIARVSKMEELLNPENLKAFKEDLIAEKLGTKVTLEEAKKISELAKGIEEKKAKIDQTSEQGSETRMDYGRSVVDFMEYVSDLKRDANKLSVKEMLQPRNYGKVLSNAAGLAKSIKATLDNSVIGRQGLKVLLTSPGIWKRNSIQSFRDIVRVFGGEEVMREVKADVISRENALNGLYKKEKLAVDVVEESYPVSVPQRIPIIGRAFKASETAFTAFQFRTRADIFDKYYEIAQKSGADISGIGQIANSLTGRGTFGPRAENVATHLNTIFFSPRLIKSHLDVLTAHYLGKNMSPFARKTAAINLLKIVGGIAGVLTVANTVSPKSVEEDSRSADFGKIRVGSTRFDVTGGMSSLAVLASRLITMSSKSSLTGNVSRLNSGEFGSRTGTDVIYDFFENKLSPAFAVMKDIVEGKDFKGNKPTLFGETNNALTPLIVANYMELKDDPRSANILVALIADGLGISTNTYSQNTNWSLGTGVQLEQFRRKVGEDKFIEANEKFNKKYNDWLADVEGKSQFTSLNDEDRQKVSAKKKEEIKQKIFKEYGFKYVAPIKKKLPKF